MRYVPYAVALLFLEIFFLVSCRGDETPSPSPTLTPTRTLIPSATLPPPTATDTPYPSETPTQRSPTNTLSATLTQTWPETPTPTPTITRTPTRTPTGQPTPTITGTPPTATPTPTITNTPSGSATPTLTLSPSPTPTGTTTTEAFLAVEPATTTITGVGNSALIYLYLTNATGVYGIDLLLSYDANLFTAIDLNPSRDGIQVQPGTCPKPDNVLVNAVDVDENEGTISYRVTQLSPTLPCNGGLILIMQFACVASGTTYLSIDDAQVSGVGIDIETVIQDGTIICQP